MNRWLMVYKHPIVVSWCVVVINIEDGRTVTLCAAFRDLPLRPRWHIAVKHLLDLGGQKPNWLHCNFPLTGAYLLWDLRVTHHAVLPSSGLLAILVFRCVPIILQV